MHCKTVFFRTNFSALQEAVEHGSVQTVDMLLDAGADANQDAAELGAPKLLRDHGGWTEWDARQYEHEKSDFGEGILAKDSIRTNTSVPLPENYTELFEADPSQKECRQLFTHVVSYSNIFRV